MEKCSIKNYGIVTEEKNKIIFSPLFGSDIERTIIELEPLPQIGSLINITNEHPFQWDLVAEPESPLVHIYTILDNLNISHNYSCDVQNEVNGLLAKGIIHNHLDDLTHIPFVTIDNDDSRDLDQALYIEKQNEQYAVYYALSDASYYVKPQMALFNEALERGVSFYLPGFSIPMLPPELSEGLISLNPNVNRRSLIFIMTLDSLGKIINFEVKRAIIKSRAKLTYNGVQQFIDNPETSELTGKIYSDSLSLLKIVGQLRIALSKKRQVVSYLRHELEIIGGSLKSDKFKTRITYRNDVSKWNEQISLMCNIEGAKRLLEKSKTKSHIQPVFRIHEPPDEKALYHLEGMIREIVKAHNLKEEYWIWSYSADSSTSSVNLAEYLENLHKLDCCKNIVKAIERQILVTNHRSMFNSKATQHYALGVKQYARFSSPMREIIGIFTHKELIEAEFPVMPSPDEEDIKLRKIIINKANRAKELQKQLNSKILEAVTVSLFENDFNTPFENRTEYSGIILGLSTSKIYVLLEEKGIEIKVYNWFLEEHFGELEVSDSKVQLNRVNESSGFLKIGDLIKFKVHSFNKNRWHLIPLI